MLAETDGALRLVNGRILRIALPNTVLADANANANANANEEG